MNHSISIGVSQEEDSRLISIIMKSLSSVGSNEIDTVFNEAQVTAQKMDLGNLIYRNPTTALFIAIFTTIVIAVVGGIIIHNHSLKKKNRQLHTAANAKTEFLSNMSHDIRTPINTIIGITELAEDDIQDPKKMEEHIQGIQTSSKYLLSIINDILDMSRIESGKFTLDYAWTPAYEVIHSCVEIMIPEMNKKHIHFIYPDGERVKNVEYYVDPLKTKRMVMNLLNNAYKFTGEDGTVTLSIKNQSFDETTSTDLVSIEDTGCGMSEEFLKKIFTPFAQEHNQYSDAQPGTGLGLSIAKQTAKAMGGDILVESKLDVGTKFTIIFPYQYRIVTHEKAEEETIHENIKDEHISAVLKGKKILLFEDNQINANIEKKILERKECTVEIAENGKIGLEKFKDSKEGFYDAILMDIRMPELNGLDAATSIRNLERTDANKVPIIAMSANAYKEDIQKSLEAGMNDHLAKPVDSVLLYETLAKYLS